jgi:pantoate--beta-alanine ligase
MHQIGSIQELPHYFKSYPHRVLVPTMGNLHEGHLSLIHAAKATGKSVIVSIFVNPTQFGPHEDFAAYPRTLAEDTQKAQESGADALFIPNNEEIYPQKQTIWIEPGPIAQKYCGISRPTHFRGVLTVVSKLFNLIQPEDAVFGRKDYQQLFLIRQMVQQLNFPVNIISVPTVRSPKGLALSSRNRYLTEEQTQQALILQQTLQKIGCALKKGENESSTLLQQGRNYLTHQGLKVDYLELANRDTLGAPEKVDKKLVILAAVYLGKSRLIDNLEIDL